MHRIPTAALADSLARLSDWLNWFDPQNWQDRKATFLVARKVSVIQIELAHRMAGAR